MSDLKYFNTGVAFELENGQVLPDLQIAYHTYGHLNATGSNVVWVCHALTANSDVVAWWPGLAGNGCVINPEDQFIICANVVGSHYGTTGPLSVDAKTGLPFYHLFPELTIRDMVKAHQLLARHLQIEKINLLIGGSLGGQQALEWSISEPNRIINLVLLATNAQHSPWGIAFNESQRLAIYADRTYFAASANGGAKGLKAARSIALLSYRHYQTYQHTQFEEDNARIGGYKAASYQQYQGEKLVSRFNAFSYVRLGQAMDSHNVGRGRASVTKALESVRAKTLVIGIDSDLLFPTNEQEFLARHIPNSVYFEIKSAYGHDGFLLEVEKIGTALQQHISPINQWQKETYQLHN